MDKKKDGNGQISDSGLIRDASPMRDSIPRSNANLDVEMNAMRDSSPRQDLGQTKASNLMRTSSPTLDSNRTEALESMRESSRMLDLGRATGSKPMRETTPSLNLGLEKEQTPMSESNRMRETNPELSSNSTQGQPPVLGSENPGNSLRVDMDHVERNLSSMQVTPRAECMSAEDASDWIVSLDAALLEVRMCESETTLAEFQDIITDIRSSDASGLKAKLRMNLALSVSKLETAIKGRYNILKSQSQAAPTPQVDQTPPSRSTQEPPRNTANPQFRTLYQFQLEMGNRCAEHAIRKLTGDAEQQVKLFSRQQMVERSARTKNSTLWDVIVSRNFHRSNITRDIAIYLLSFLEPKTCVDQDRQPFLNVDYHFACTIFALKTDNTPYEEFKGAHKESAVTLNALQKFPLKPKELEAQFAFKQGSRWFKLEFDSRMNLHFNECIGFYLANGFYPQQHKQNSPCVRVLLVRDGNTSCWDGVNVYFYSEHEQKFYHAYHRLAIMLSPVLKFGNFRQFLLSPQVPLGHMKSLPPPPQYEAVLPIMSSWACSSKNFLTQHYKRSFFPCLGIGGWYLPAFADSSFAVHGRTIKAMPKFHGDTSISDLHWYNWNTRNGYWVTIADNNVSGCFFHETYAVNVSDYGSVHFYTQFQRHESKHKVLQQPYTLYGEVTEGFSPSTPAVKDDAFIEKVMLSSVYQKSNQIKDAAFKSLLDERCQSSLEWQLRFGRFKGITGLESYLTWVPAGETGSLFDLPYYPDQVQGVYELLQAATQYSSIDQYYSSNADWNNFVLVPRSLISHYQPTSGRYVSSLKTLERQEPRLEYNAAPNSTWRQNPSTSKQRANKRSGDWAQQSAQQSKKGGKKG